jgi:hypothetical protein
MSHVPVHWFQGVCICPCKDCTVSGGLRHVRCICPECPKAICGAKEGFSI